MPGVRKAPTPAAQVAYSWSGLYIGGNVGYGWGRFASNYSLNNIPVSQDTVDPSGIVGGGQIGLNWQLGSVVLGAEADFQGSDHSAGNTFISCPAANPVCGGVNSTTVYTEKMEWFGTARGRIGYAFDRFMVYGTAGAAYARFAGDATITCPAPACVTIRINSANTKTGWTAGGGIEGALVGSWTWKLEYLYFDYGTVTVTDNSVPGLSNRSETKITDNVVRAGVNYRFGGL